MNINPRRPSERIAGTGVRKTASPSRVARRVAAACAVLLAGFSSGAVAQGSSPVITELRLDGVVDPFISDYIADEIAAANARSDDAILLTIDTPGGLDSSMRTIVQAIMSSESPVICYVSPEGARAASAGTFILLSCSVAAMAPGTNVGAAHPVGISGAVASEKAENDAAAYIRSIAEERGRNADWAERAVRESVSISAQDALDTGVVDVVEPTTESLLSTIDGRRVEVAEGAGAVLDTANADIQTLSPGLGTRILHTLLGPDFSFIFFYLGLGLIVIELLHPGISVPGILGVLSLVASFASLGMLPFEIIGVGLLLASTIFLVLELQVPGPGVFTVGALITVVLGGLLLFDPAVPSARVSIWTIAPVAGVLLLLLVTLVPAARRARRLPYEADSARLVGLTGIVTEDLDPEGVVLLTAESWTAYSDVGRVPKGARVRVIEVDGLTLKVEPLVEEGAPTAGGLEEGRS
jgi:membrane-bound serine protease (ClpP class)